MLLLDHKVLTIPTVSSMCGNFNVGKLNEVVTRLSHKAYHAPSEHHIKDQIKDPSLFKMVLWRTPRDRWIYNLGLR